jgi:hypothetical protein
MSTKSMAYALQGLRLESGEKCSRLRLCTRILTIQKHLTGGLSFAVSSSWKGISNHYMFMLTMASLTSPSWFAYNTGFDSRVIEEDITVDFQTCKHWLLC